MVSAAGRLVKGLQGEMDNKGADENEREAHATG